MELRHIRYFVAVAEARNFTRAAAALNIAQSPLSQQIRQLEREIGVPLLTRTTRSVSLTYAGEVFFERAQALLTSAATAVEDARKARCGEIGAISVGLAGSATYELLPALVHAYTDRHPDVTIEVHSDLTTPVQSAQLLDGRLSVGILRPPVDAPGLSVEIIRREPVFVMLDSRHRATVQRQINLADLRDSWFISFPSDPPSTMYSVMLNACQAVGFTPRIRQTVAESASLVALVAAGMGVALVPASLRHLRVGGTTFRPLQSPRVTTELALAYREDDVNPLIRRFLDTVRTVVRSRDVVATPALPPFSDEDRPIVEY